MKQLNRSFGFLFRDKLLQGSIYHNGSIDVHFFYEDEEFESTEKFTLKYSLTPEEQKIITDKVNGLINKQ